MKKNFQGSQGVLEKSKGGIVTKPGAKGQGINNMNNTLNKLPLLQQINVTCP